MEAVEHVSRPKEGNLKSSASAADDGRSTIGGSGGGPGSCFSRTIIVPPTGGVGGCKYLTKT